MTAAYQLNAIYQIVRTMQRTPEGRKALEDKKRELRERGLARDGKRKENKNERKILHCPR